MYTSGSVAINFYSIHKAFFFFWHLVFPFASPIVLSFAIKYTIFQVLVQPHKSMFTALRISCVIFELLYTYFHWWLFIPLFYSFLSLTFGSSPMLSVNKKQKRCYHVRRSVNTFCDPIQTVVRSRWHTCVAVGDSANPQAKRKKHARGGRRRRHRQPAKVARATRSRPPPPSPPPPYKPG